LDLDKSSKSPTRSGPAAIVWIFLAIGLLLVLGAISYMLLSRQEEPVPQAIASDPLLLRGRAIYLERCLNCHGPSGQGDGPIAKGLTGPPPRNLAKDPWKYGDRPDQVLAVLADGVKDAQMPGWSGNYGPEDLKAVAAYVYQIAGKPVPDTLRGK
jgi:cytochrome c oxidase cbb3-type subunit 3